MPGYGNIDDFKSYNEERGREIPESWDDDFITKVLLVASEWLDNKYDNSWIGFATNGYLQERKWPRTTAYTNTYPVYIFANDEIPDAVVNAVYEAAFREATTSGSLQKDFTPNKYNKVSVDGAISVEYNTSITQSADVEVQIPIIDSLMYPLMNLSSQGSFNFASGGSTRV